MTTRRCPPAWVAALVSVAVLIPGAASAATVRFGAALVGTDEMPPNASTSTGSAFGQLDDVARQLTLSVSVSASGVTRADVRGPAAPGSIGPVIFSVDLPRGFGAIAVTLTPAQAADLLAGLWYVNVPTPAFPEGELRGQLVQARIVAAVLPASRSVQVGAPATVFASIVNIGPETARDCTIGFAAPTAATIGFQTTNPGTNTVTGTLNAPVSIGSGQSQSFALFITPTAPIAPTDVPLAFDCANSPPAPTLSGVNTLLLSASPTPVADVVAIAAPPPTFFAPGTLVIDGGSRQGAFALAAINVGVADTVTVRADTGSASLPVSFTLCRTDLATAACLAPPAASVTTAMGHNEPAGFAVFVTSTARIPFDPGASRIFLRFRDGAGAVRGATSLAVMGN